MTNTHYDTDNDSVDHVCAICACTNEIYYNICNCNSELVCNDCVPPHTEASA